MTEKMNRRNFLRVAAAAPATLGAGSVFAASTSGTPAPAHWDYEADVVVIGCGAAGLMAAVQAFDGGAKVVVFDKGMSPYHTSTRLNGGCFAAVGSRIQKEHGVKDSPEAFVDNMSAYGDGMTLREPALTYARNSGAAFDWMVDHGLAPGMWQPYNGHTNPRTVRQKTYNGKDYIDILVRECNKRGIKIHHDRALQKVFYDEKANRVLGVACGNRKVTETAHAAKGVILATGGLTGSPTEVGKWSPVLSDAVTIGGGANNGDAMRVVIRDVGTPITHMQYFAEYPYALATGPGRGPQIRYQYFVDEGAMLVNKEGKRFVNESLAPTLISPSMERNSDKSMYLLMTTDQFERATKKYPFGALLSSPQWTRARWDTELAKGRVIVQGNTIEEAAKKIGVDPKGLLDQVAEWNQTVASGRDLKFGRTKFAGKFEGTHFFMAKINVWVCLSMGGFKVDKHLQVLGWNDQPVGGLYAAGETVGGIHGAHYLGGDACGFAHTSGYVTGRLLTGQKVVI